MKRLFTVNGEHFANKEAAKVARGEPIKKIRTEKLEGGREVTLPAEYKHTIEYGPDHWKRGGAVPGQAPKPTPVKRTRKAKPVLADYAEVTI